MHIRVTTFGRRAKLAAGAGVALWAMCATAGLVALERYAARPGDAARPGASWPAGSGLRRDATRDTLVVLFHPRCPCSRATVGELARLVAQCGGRVAVDVVFVKPAGTAQGWEQTDLWRDAAAIPGVMVTCDADGSEAARFDASTSGQTVLYDRDGRLLFRGGITDGRGHAGDNAGRDAIVDLVLRGSSSTDHTEVYGCALATPGSGGGAAAACPMPERSRHP